MAKYEIGDLLRRLRTENGKSQKQLCEGLCSQANYSKIENGEQMPHEELFDAILQRLGLSSENYYGVFLTKDDYENFSKKQYLRGLLIAENYNEAANVVAELENMPTFKEDFNLQFILDAKASIALTFEKDYSKARDLLYKAIHITKPNFDEKRISSYTLTHEEIIIINMIALVKGEEKEHNSAINILYELKKSMDDFCKNSYEKVKKYPLIMYNLSKYLGLQGRYDEAIRVCCEAMELCRNQGKYSLYPYFLYNKLWCFQKKGNIDDCKNLLPVAYYGFKMVGNCKNAEHVKKYAKDNFGLEI